MLGRHGLRKRRYLLNPVPKDQSGTIGANVITVERAMIAFKNCLDDSNCARNDVILGNLSLALAHTCRSSLGSSWGFEAEQLRGDYQKLIEDMEKRFCAGIRHGPRF
jgi:hypothetical protein